MARLELTGVEKCFGSIEVLRDVSRRIADGEFIVLVGPSGCGKSTLLRMIAGLEEISAGKFSIDGKRPIIVLSGYRDKDHNACVGAAAGSCHMKFMALDLANMGGTTAHMHQIAERLRMPTRKIDLKTRKAHHQVVPVYWGRIYF